MMNTANTEKIKVHLPDGNGGVDGCVEDTVDNLLQRARDDDAVAQFALAIAYYNGHVVEQSDRKAAEYARQSADGGYSNGQWFYALLREKGKAGMGDAADAERYYLAAARNNHHRAALRLGVLLLAGGGSRLGVSDAIPLLRQAQAGGFAQAEQYEIAARMIVAGRGNGRRLYSPVA